MLIVTGNSRHLKENMATHSHNDQHGREGIANYPNAICICLTSRLTWFLHAIVCTDWNKKMHDVFLFCLLLKLERI